MSSLPGVRRAEARAIANVKAREEAKAAVPAPAVNPFVDFIRRYKNDPVAFVREVLGAEPDEWQADFLRAVARGDRRITVKSGHGVGKSTAASWAALWYFLTRNPVKVVITAPTKAQLFDALFNELKSWVGRLQPGVRDLLDVKSDRIELIAAPADAFISARTSRAETPEALAGIHSANVMLIGDEASGIPETVFEAAAGSMSGSSAVTLLLGNPVRSSGYFFDTHTKLKGQWTCFNVSCRTSPRVDPEWINEMATRYGEMSNAFRVRVEGEFPLADDDTVIPYEWVAAAAGRDIVVDPDTPVIWGLDVARFGTDASALVKRRGRHLLEPPKLYRGYDLMQLCGVITAEYESAADKFKPAEIMVDVIGVGAGAFDRLRELGLPVRGINVSESPAMKASYQNLRAELMYKLRGWFEARDVTLPDRADSSFSSDQSDAMLRLIEDLTAIKYKFAEGSGKIQIESKKDMRKRTGRSPDAGDALMLTFASNAISALKGRAGGTSWNRPIRRNIKGIV